ncbi:uncharacterized protein PHACADRAFT_197262 [Phanerochaete carnosa HHB-10118-sp]|uniref:NACHT domain-containing protein n=1 Tax=Phanerochaete carnosa (strain HHB-10118-sp) TaxID=650164 RepID=K5WWM0_PHACS|nr:uncharacterized protein PHACADRAFT_197262 [Phanerochaete carnosa HHB-10118-sp]EKM54837.1 hypothetical protein PHACADRAFT_197262 [Phanerochaete carnosa HHB-10118-sp]
MSTPNTQPGTGDHDASAGSLGFQRLWEDAMKKYNDVTGKDLRCSSLFDKMSGAGSIEEVESILREHDKGFKAFRANGEKARAVIAPIVTLTKLFVDAGGEIAAASSVVPGGKAIFTAFGVFLEVRLSLVSAPCKLFLPELTVIKAAEKVSKRFDDLEGLLSRLGGVLSRLRNHLQSCSALSVELEGIFVGALIQLLNVLAICTKYIRKRTSWRTVICKRTKDYGRALLGDKDVEDALKELDRLTAEELLAAAAQILDVVQSVDANVGLIGNNVMKLGDDVEAVGNNVADLQATGAKSLNLHLDKDIQDWLAPPDPSQTHEERRTSHLTGTCMWFFDSKFEEWKNSNNGVYWIHGNPGTGKSVLCSSIIEHVSSTPGLHVAYFYFDYRRTEMQTVTGLLASLIYQLATCSEQCHKVLEQFRKDNRAKLSPTRELLISCLERILQTSAGAVIIIDALDECSPSTRQDGLFPTLHRLVSKDIPGLRILLTSRPEADIQKAMDDFPAHQLRLHDADAHTRDLATYISHCLAGDDYSEWPADVKVVAEKELKLMASGM